MAVTASHQDERSVAEEAELAHAAAAGDGAAFATLYERYETRAFNLAFRITGSQDDAADATQDAFLNVLKRLPKLRDRDLVFGSYLFTATRNACYDLMAKRKRAEPSDTIPETAAPVGSGGAFDPGDPDDDGDRKVLVEAQGEEIRAANARLPDRQREVLALRELEELSYDDIAEIMDMNRNSVAQLISRARINLRDELRGTALTAIVAATPDCERALPLIALRDDGQLDPGSDDGAWLAEHLGGCDTCRLSEESMQEAGLSYRAWAPIAASPLLFKETVAKAAELTGSDWSHVIAGRAASGAGAGAGGAAGSSVARASGLRAHRGRDAVIAAGLTAALLVGVFGAATDDPGVPEPVEPVAERVAAPQPAKKPAKKPAGRAKKKQRRTGPAAAAPARIVTAEGDLVPATPVGGGTPNSTPAPTPAPRRTPPRRRAVPGTGGGGGTGGGTPPPVVHPDPPPVVVEPPVIDPPPPLDPPTRPPGATVPPR